MPGSKGSLRPDRDLAEARGNGPSSQEDGLQPIEGVGPPLLVKRQTLLRGEGPLLDRDLGRCVHAPKGEGDDGLLIVRVGIVI